MSKLAGRSGLLLAAAVCAVLAIAVIWYLDQADAPDAQVSGSGAVQAVDQPAGCTQWTRGVGVMQGMEGMAGSPGPGWICTRFADAAAGMGGMSGDE